MTGHDDYARSAGYELRNPSAPNLALLLHGLGGDRNQPMRLLGEQFAEFAVLAPDARAHGATELIGEPSDFRFPAMVDDLGALLAHLGQADKPMYVTGISMGAALGLQLVLTARFDVRGAAFIRPAFDEHADPGHLAALTSVADLLDTLGPLAGAAQYVESAQYCAVSAVSPRAAAGLRAQFASPGARERSTRLREIAKNAAYADGAELRGIRTPTLVIGAAQDPEHPLALAQQWASLIPAAELTIVTPRDRDLARYETEIAASVRAHARAVFGGGTA